MTYEKKLKKNAVRLRLETFIELEQGDSTKVIKDIGMEVNFAEIQDNPDNQIEIHHITETLFNELVERMRLALKEKGSLVKECE